MNRLAQPTMLGLHILQYFPDRLDDISYDPTPIETWPYRLIFTRSPRGEALNRAFNQGLEALKERQKVQIHLNNVANGVYLPTE
ncbi:hypothetical protein [Saccharospirillum impatiens]|uniref:hypothetical protein n=1 Tax=Saccharospirillum impatiens TaxID=169438 RepID=UPI00048C0D6D|nr:hypothetical protein [Saccharospirillum impatiens]